MMAIANGYELIRELTVEPPAILIPDIVAEQIPPPLTINESTQT